MKILIADPLGNDGLQLLKKQPGYEVVERPGLSKKELLGIIGRFDALIVRSATKADSDVVTTGKKLRVIARAGVGTDNIDIKAASKRGIVVTNTPGANTLAAVEHTFALMLALCRKVPQADAAVKAGEWGRSRFVGTQLFGKTLGVIGLGRIGAQVATRAQAFEMNVLASDPYLSEARARELGLKLVSLPKLLKESDFVTLHAPSTEATRGLMSAQNLARMKKGARLINCARGDLIDEAALYKVLKSGRLAGAALDVYRAEPPTGSPLLKLDNVVLTPHLAASTAEAQAQVSLQVARQVIGILAGERFENVLNLPFRGPFGEMRPYLSLSARIGSLSAQICGGRVRRVEWDYAGGPAEFAGAILIALLRGVLQPVFGDEVNYVNAQQLADDQRLEIVRVEKLASGHAHGTVACRLTAGRKLRMVVGELVAEEWPRVVQIDGYRLDAEPTGDLLFMVSRDVPGVIGKIGTLLGKAKVNIGEWRLGRDRENRRAVTLMNLDSPIPATTLSAVRRLTPVLEAHPVSLGSHE